MKVSEQLNILEPVDHAQRLARVFDLMEANGFDSMIVNINANIYYLTGRVFNGLIYLSLATRTAYNFVRRPNHLTGENTYAMHKPENILQIIDSEGLPALGRTAFELSLTPYATIQRLTKALGTEIAGDADAVLRVARSVKTAVEQQLIAECGIKHERVYRKIPGLFREGMTDVELQVEIERISRLEGCIGQFRAAGTDMEIHMGSVLAGENADTPSPYDFSMGGRGMDPSLPIGADNSIIQHNTSVMVDTNGAFNGYMTDMTRTFAVGNLGELAERAHQVSVEITHRLGEMARPGAKASELYEEAMKMATEAGLAEYFMGHRQHAAFVGHGIGIEINELPVISPRSRDILAVGNVIAIEPKFVIPGVGAVGIENSYIIGEDATRCVTNAPEQLIQLQ